MMKTLVVTGGIGSGKSAVTTLLASRGVPVYDSDSRTKALYDQKPELVDRMEERFGLPLRLESGLMDRKKLAGLIFSDPAALRTLEALVHPVVREDFLSWREALETSLCVLESAIILSKPLFDGLYDKVLFVDAPAEVRLRRVMLRDGLPEEEVLARMKVQETDLSKVDLVLLNDGTLDDLDRRLDRALRFLFSEELLPLQQIYTPI